MQVPTNNEQTWDQGGENGGSPSSPTPSLQHPQTHQKHPKAQVVGQACEEFPKPLFYPAHHLLSGDVGTINRNLFKCQA
jgi:hypothetical protein